MELWDIEQREGAPEAPSAGRRRPWVALLLNIACSPLGHVYAGRAGRGVVLLAALSPFGVIAVMAVLSFRPIAGVFAFLLSLAAILALPPIDAFRVARQAPQPYRLRRYNRVWIYALIAVGVTIANTTEAGFIRRDLLQAFKIPAASMEPTLRVGDHILVDKRAFIPARGDIVVFPFPEDPQKSFVKRIVGLPGETIEIREQRVLINGTALDEPYVQHTDANAMREKRDQMPPLTLPAGEYFVMGDNRDHSYDSRFWGPIPGVTILGRVRTIYLSWGDQGINWSRLGKAVE